MRSLKEIELIDDRRVKAAKLKGELISKSLVENHFLISVDSCLKQLLSDGSKTISKRLKIIAQAGKFDGVEVC